MNEVKLTFDELTDPTKRDTVVAAYKAMDLGGERYGVVCPLFTDEARTQRCNKRICPQGWAFATSLENSGKYCMHRENYDGTEPAESITTILEHHGLPWRPLRTLTRMRENKPNKKKGSKKNVKKEQGSQERTGNNAQARGTDPSLGVDSGGYGKAPGEVPPSGRLPEEGTETFGDYLNGKVDGAGRSTVSPSNGPSERARLFLARRERELQEGRERGEILPGQPS